MEIREKRKYIYSAIRNMYGETDHARLLIEAWATANDDRVSILYEQLVRAEESLSDIGQVMKELAEIG